MVSWLLQRDRWIFLRDKLDNPELNLYIPVGKKLISETVLGFLGIRVDNSERK